MRRSHKSLSVLLSIKSLAQPGGGAERAFSTLVSGLCARGHRLTLLTFDKPEEPSFYPIDSRAQRFHLGDGELAGEANIGVLMARVREIRSFLRGRHYDVAVGFMHSMYVPLSFALIGRRTPLLASEHTVREYYADRSVELGLLRVAASLSDRFSVISSNAGDGFPAGLHRKMVVMPNPVTTPDGVLHESKNNKRVLSVGRLVALKDHRTLILAFARLATSFPDWSLRIVGDGEMRGELERLISKVGLAGRVELPGFTSKVGEEYASADIFVQPSKYESFGIATAEASAHGLPCLGFADCPGTNELIIDGVTGELALGPDRVASLHQKLVHLISDPELRAKYGQAGRLRVKEFSPERCVDRLEALLYEITDR